MIIWTRNPLMFPQILAMDPIAVTHGSEAHPPAIITVTGIVTIALGLVVMLSLWVLVEFSRVGRGMRAVAENPGVPRLAPQRCCPGWKRYEEGEPAIRRRLQKQR